MNRIYPVEPWSVTEERFDPANNYRNETTFALSNGYIGTRGTFEEGYAFSVDEGLEGNFINGFYESGHVRYGEWNFGFPTESQTMLNLPNCKRLCLTIGGELFDMRTGELLEYRRSLRMDTGVVERSLVWRSPKGRTIRLDSTRLVSLTDKNLMAMRYRVTALDFEGEAVIESMLDGDVENHTRKTNPLVDYGPFGRCIEPERTGADSNMLYFEGTTRNTRLTVACGSASVPFGSAAREFDCGTYSCTDRMTFSVKKGGCFGVDKVIAYSSSLDMPREKLRGFVADKLATADTGRLIEEQAEYMRAYWNSADVTIDGDDALVQGLRFNLFHIMQAAGRDGRTGMGAKGLSGEGYEGHYFWDTEMYALPVLIYTAPEVARKLLEYRFRTLDQARDRARVLGHMTGALYPWRTINGEEASTYFPLGTAQYHINGDVAYAFRLYCTVTGDLAFLRDMAAEVLCETARVWADVGGFAECRGGRYCICSVTGPDEYNAIVDNNFYTNLLARENLRWALDALSQLEGCDPDACADLRQRLDLTTEETERWCDIADNMYLPYDRRLGIFPQDDGFLMRREWDEFRIPEEKRHLLYENYHPLFIYRQRMSKQADAILAMQLFAGYFSEEELRRNYDYYSEVTLHHSSLSTCVFGMLAARIGYREDAYRFFMQSARMDLDDVHGNFYAGIHAANMAGTWQAVIFGFAGVRYADGMLELAPYVPENWNGYAFKLCVRGCVLAVEVGQTGVSVELIEGDHISLRLLGREITLNEKGETARESL